MPADETEMLYPRCYLATGPPNGSGQDIGDGFRNLTDRASQALSSTVADMGANDDMASDATGINIEHRRSQPLSTAGTDDGYGVHGDPFVTSPLNGKKRVQVFLPPDQDVQLFACGDVVLQGSVKIGDQPTQQWFRRVRVMVAGNEVVTVEAKDVHNTTFADASSGNMMGDTDSADRVAAALRAMDVPDVSESEQQNDDTPKTIDGDTLKTIDGDTLKTIDVRINGAAVVRTTATQSVAGGTANVTVRRSGGDESVVFETTGETIQFQTVETRSPSPSCASAAL